MVYNRFIGSDVNNFTIIGKCLVKSFDEPVGNSVFVISTDAIFMITGDADMKRVNTAVFSF